MTNSRLKIKTPRLGMKTADELNAIRCVRIHNRFQGLLISIIESANWANWRMTDKPIETYHPHFEQGGGFCDLVLCQRQTNHNKVLMEVKTKSVRSTQGITPFGVAADVMDKMGARLTQLQQTAHDEDAIWVVAVGIYKTPTSQASLGWSIDFDVVMVWGRGVGQFSPQSRYHWASLYDLDSSMNSYLKVEDFWTLIDRAPPKLPAPPLKEPPRPTLTAGTPKPTLTAGTLFDTAPSKALTSNSKIEKILEDSSGLTKAERAAIRLASTWPSHTLDIKTACERIQPLDVGWKAVSNKVKDLSALGVIEGYTYRSRRHYLSINMEKLIKFIEFKEPKNWGV